MPTDYTEAEKDAMIARYQRSYVACYPKSRARVVTIGANGGFRVSAGRGHMWISATTFLQAIDRLERQAAEARGAQ